MRKIIILFLLLVIMVSCNKNSREWIYKGEKVMIYVDDAPIVNSEIEFFKKRVRTKVFSYYKEKYNLDNIQDFWNQSFDNEEPKETLEEWAKESTIKDKVIHILLKEYGIIDSIDFKSFKNLLVKENDRRKEAIKNETVIYGPQQYSFRLYYDYLLSNNILKLKRQEKSKILSLDKTKNTYEEVKSKIFMIPADITVSIISIPYAGNANYSFKEAKMLIQKIQKKIRTVIDIKPNEDYLNSLSEVNFFSEYVLKGKTRRTDGEYFGQLLSHIVNLKKGKVSSVINIDHKLSLVFCYDRKDNGYAPFNEARGQLEAMEMDEWFEKLVNDRVKKSNIKEKL